VVVTLRRICVIWTVCAFLPVMHAHAVDVWLDVDVAAGLHERDVDDALALIQAFHSPELTIRGISAVYGNAPLADGLPIAREIVERFGPEGMAVHAGAATAEDLGRTNAAVQAMANALVEKPMTILALGPLTNVGSLLTLHPDVHDAIDSVVIVAARREGQVFNYPTARSASLPDFNFENDPAAMQVILDSDIDIVFAPWEVSSHVWLTTEDLIYLAQRGGPGAWIAEKSAGWIAMWLRRFGTPGFNPFDTLAVAWVTHPRLIEAIPVSARIEHPDPDADPGPTPPKPELLVTPGFDSGTHRRIDYAYRPAHGFKPILIRRLAGIRE